jgi:phosphatidate cytidylyltransferase
VSRVLSAAILVAILAVTIWKLPWWATVVLAALAAAIAGAELAGLARAVGAPISSLFPATFAAAGAVAVSATRMTTDVLVAVLLSGFVAAGLLTLASGRPGPATITGAAVTAMAPLYLGLPLGVLAAIRVGWGPGPLTWLVAVIALSDSAQYYTGRAFGRRKLAPLVSPGKTVEGAIGGLAVAVVAGTALARLWLPGVPLASAALLSLFVAGSGIGGDLFESLLKRSAGVKDSSTLIPGHGGVLDRVDAHLFAAPIYYLFLRYLA